MAKKKLLPLLFKSAWFHYLLLTGVLFLDFFTANWLGFVSMNSELSTQKWILLFVWYYIFISIGDQFIHRIIGVD